MSIRPSTPPRARSPRASSCPIPGSLCGRECSSTSSSRWISVFVEDASGKLEPREVETGERSGDAIQIVRGVAAGERVATRANFLLDAESRITGAAPRALAPAAPPAPDEVHR